MPTLRQLRYFESLARHLNFGRAAAECAISQPALSLQIQDLETKLGIELVERGKAAISLTPVGQDVAVRAGRILAEVGDLVDFARGRGKPLSGPLRLGVIPSIGPYLLPSILPVLRAEAPELELQVRESQTAQLLDALMDRKIDLILLALPIDRPGVTQVGLFEDPFFVLTPSGHRLAGQGAIAMDDLQSEKVLLLEEGHCLRDQALNLCSQAGVDGVEEFGATSLATIVQLAGNGYGVTILPELAREVETRSHAHVAVADFARPRPSRTIGLAWRDTSRRKEDFLEFGRLIRQARAA
ncbi:hydrogen peroxide-inducible genes activator [Aestuariivirga sp.]|uniref:hydrogen peroxide-inducible genes activator n=1 Tax=Aestuariivirga sp. TaxID=2650926 RepID=UPI0039E52424